MITKEELKAGLETVRAVAEAIHDAREVPAGQLYAVLCPVMGLAEFERIIGMLVRTGLVARDQSHLLRWVSPVRETATAP